MSRRGRSCAVSWPTAPMASCEFTPSTITRLAACPLPLAHAPTLRIACRFVVGDDGTIRAGDVRQQLLSGAWAQVRGWRRQRRLLISLVHLPSGRNTCQTLFW